MQAAEPFLIVTALADETRFSAALQQRQIHTVERAQIEDWPTLSTALHAHDASSPRALAYEQAWSQHSPKAWVWRLQTRADLSRLAQQKRALRALFPSLELQVELHGQQLQVRLHAFHSPDFPRYEEEWRMIVAAR